MPRRSPAPRFRRPTLAIVIAAIFASSASQAPAAAPRNDYANAAFTAALSHGLDEFYARHFKGAQEDFERALTIVPDNTLAISFLDAAAAQQPGALDILVNSEEDAVSAAPKSYGDHVRLGFAYLFQSTTGRDRTQDAREEFTSAITIDAAKGAAHVGLGIMRFNERSANRAKVELATALAADPSDVLAREYLGQLYQTDLRDPQRGLSYVIDVPNLVPRYADIAFHIGSLMYDLHQPQSALTYLQRGIDLDTGHVGEAGQHGYTLIARIYLDEHRTKDATAILDRAIAADVDTIYAKTLLEKIKNGDYDAASAPAKS